jgi:hypothetical protein
MAPRMTSADEQALLLADILHGVPDKLARVQTALKPVAQGKNIALSVEERGIVAQACTALQFAMSDIRAVLAVARESIKNRLPVIAPPRAPSRL